MFELFVLFFGAFSLMDGIVAAWHGRRKKAIIFLVVGMAAVLYAVSQIHQSVLPF